MPISYGICCKIYLRKNFKIQLIILRYRIIKCVLLMINDSFYSAEEWPISLDMACHKALSAIACSFEYTNVANEDYYLLKHNTPLEGLRSPFITVSQDGVRLQYQGMYVRRAPPTKQAFVLLKAGKSATATVQLNDIFTFSTDGLYNIQYAKPLQFISKKRIELQSATDKIEEVGRVKVRESVSIHLEDTASLSRPVEVEEEEEEGEDVYIEACGSVHKYIGATQAQKTATTAAHKKLCPGFLAAKRSVGNNDDYRTWFGTYTAARAKKVKKVLGKTRKFLKRKKIRYNFSGNGCNSGDYAYTYYKSKTIWLCEAYDDDPTYCRMGGSSKEETLAHEWTHASSNTEDYEYGVADCQQLARDDPAKAVNNADNYAFYYCRT